MLTLVESILEQHKSIKVCLKNGCYLLNRVGTANHRILVVIQILEKRPVLRKRLRLCTTIKNEKARKKKKKKTYSSKEARRIRSNLHV